MMARDAPAAAELSVVRDKASLDLLALTLLLLAAYAEADLLAV
jgi:hypothetical protein